MTRLRVIYTLFKGIIHYFEGLLFSVLVACPLSPFPFFLLFSETVLFSQNILLEPSLFFFLFGRYLPMKNMTTAKF